MNFGICFGKNIIVYYSKDESENTYWANNMYQDLYINFLSLWLHISTLKWRYYFSHFTYKVMEALKDQVQECIVNTLWALHWSAGTLKFHFFFIIPSSFTLTHIMIERTDILHILLGYKGKDLANYVLFLLSFPAYHI